MQKYTPQALHSWFWGVMHFERAGKSCSFANCLFLPTLLLFLCLCVKEKNLEGRGVKDMSAHSSAPRGHRSPPRSEPEGLTNQPSSAAVAPLLLLFLLCWFPLLSEGVSLKKKYLRSDYSVQDDRAERMRRGEFLLLAAAHLITQTFFPLDSPYPPCPSGPFNCLLVSVGGLVHSNTIALQGQSLYPFFFPLPVLFSV